MNEPANTAAAMRVQVGGKHYKGMAIQPFELGQANEYDSCAFSIMKYISRHAAKDGKEGLQKAIHIVSIRLHLMDEYGVPTAPRNGIPMLTFCTQNGLPGEETEALLALDDWCCRPRRRAWPFGPRRSRDSWDHTLALDIIKKIQRIIDTRY